MPTLTINYSTWPTHRRRNNAGLGSIAPTATGSFAAGDSIPIFAFESILYEGKTYVFVFMSASGAADGNHLFLEPGNYSLTVGAGDLRVSLMYVQSNGNGHGDPEVYIDAFNVDADAFSDSDFVRIRRGGAEDAAASATANEYGVVSTAQAAEIQAFSTVDGLPFDAWRATDGSEYANRLYSVPQGHRGFAFAFYMTASKNQYKEQLKEKELVYEKEFKDRADKLASKDHYFDKAITKEFAPDKLGGKESIKDYREGKDFAEWKLSASEQSIPDIPFDPAELRSMKEKLAALEKTVARVATFIEKSERPIVGEELMKQAKKTK